MDDEWDGGPDGAGDASDEVYNEMVAVEVVRVVDNFSYHSEAMQLPQLLTNEFANSLRMSTLRSVFINGSKVGRLTDDQVGSFTHCIVKSNILLECLSLSYHHITDAGLGYICSALMYAAPSSNDPQQSMRLELLDLEGNLITAKGIPALRLHSNEECPLLSLNLSYNKLDEEGGMIVAEALSVNRVLRQLLVNNCGFTVNSTIAIATSLSRLSKNGKSVLEELQIDRPNLARAIGEDCVDHFSCLCASPNSGLMALSLRHYGCGDLGAKLVAQSLSRRDSMISINLECNKIGVAGAEALASYLIAQAKRGANSVRSLRLSYNCIGTEGAIALAEALTQTNTLAELTLKNNQIGPLGLLALGEALFRNNTLQVLSVFGNDFETGSGKLFMSVLERAPYVGLSLDVLSYEVDGTFMVAEAN